MTMPETATLNAAPRAEELRRLFEDRPEETFVNYDAFDPEAVTERIRADGYAIVRDLIPEQPLQAVRDFWLERFKQVEGQKAERVTWAPYLGQANTIGFSDDKFQCLYRSCDFLWNPPFDRTTREIGVRLNGLRNLLIGQDPLRGVKFSSDRYGVFVTTSYYPPGRGWLGTHADGVDSDVPLVHHIAPLTFKGPDYAGGGLVIVDRAGKTVDVDARLTKGSVLFYNGALPHGVERVEAHPGRSLGRMQMFAIPTSFTNVELNVYAVGQVPTKTFARAKWMRLKNRLLVSLGFSQIIR